MLSYPEGVCYLPVTDHIIVSDRNNHRLEVFDKTGKFVTKWGTQGSSAGQFVYPRAVAFNSLTHQIIVADYSNNRLQVFG